MKLAVLSFTRQGSICCEKLVKGLRGKGETCSGYVQEKFLDTCHEVPGLIPVRQTVYEWTREQFTEADGLIFIGAAGIAVRAIAPYLKDKKTDPAVVVVDEKGTWAISLLSGHAGGANRLTKTVAGILAGTAVITTATDVEGKAAIDVFAVEAGLTISDWQLAKIVSAEILEEHPVGFFSDFSWPEEIPEGFTQKQNCEYHVWVTAKNVQEKEDLITLFLTSESRILRLIPPIYCVGIGCRKGTPKSKIEHALSAVMRENNLAVEGIAAFASIDLKKEEPGIRELAGEWKIKFLTYSKDELNAVKGDFTASAFVKQVTGADNVCERSALACAGEQGTLLVRKQAACGVTIAVARQPWSVESKNSKEPIWQTY